MTGPVSKTDWDAIAKKASYMILESGNAFERRLGRATSLYLFRDGDWEWSIWLASWSEGQKIPYREKTIASRIPLQKAIELTSSMIDRSNAEVTRIETEQEAKKQARLQKEMELLKSREERKKRKEEKERKNIISMNQLDIFDIISGFLDHQDDTNNIDDVEEFVDDESEDGGVNDYFGDAI